MGFIPTGRETGFGGRLKGLKAALAALTKGCRAFPAQFVDISLQNFKDQLSGTSRELGCQAPRTAG